ncbi:hypothetical protein JCM33374_g262 [Metschnikowia sp. JCM 33374]|nr:hypothetical protein JCM33374_g262 [Metschnikowia sp. JCM 33374]
MDIVIEERSSSSITTVLPQVRLILKQVMSPDAKQEIYAKAFSMDFGQKLNDVGLVSVWKYYFLAKVKEFDDHIHAYFLGGMEGLQKLITLDDEKDIKCFHELVELANQYLNRLFHENITENLRMKTKVLSKVNRSLINEFFKTFEPSESEFTQMHVDVGEYFLAERRRQATTDFKRAFHSYTLKTSTLINVVIVLLDKGYRKTELIEVFKELKAEGQKQINESVPPEDKHVFASMIASRVSDYRGRYGQPQMIAYVKGKSSKQNSKKKTDLSKVECYKCHEKGHYSNDCHKSSIQNTKRDAYSIFVSFIWDSGSDAHVVNDMSYFWNFREVRTAFETVNGKSQPAYSLGYGDMRVRYGKAHEAVLTNVHYIPESNTCLFSYAEGMKDGIKTWFGDYTVTTENNEVIGSSSVHGKPVINFEALLPRNTIYHVGEPIPKRLRLIGSVTTSVHIQRRTIFSVNSSKSIPRSKRLSEFDPMEIHRHLGHPNEEQFNIIKRKDKRLEGVPHVKTMDCNACAMARSVMQRPKFSHITKVDYPMQILHVDVCGPFPDVAYDRSSCFVTIVDDFARFTYAAPIRNKNFAAGHIQSFVNRSFARFRGMNFCIAIRVDNGGEFVNKDMIKWMFHKGIDFQKTVPGSSHQNGTVEKKQQSIQTKIRTLLADANVPTVFWPDALRVSVDFLNWLPSKSIDSERPVDRWFGKQSEFKEDVTFGTLAHVHIPHHHPKSKLHPKSIVACYLGPSPDRAAGRFYSHEVDTVFESDQARFDTSRFYFEEYFPQFQKLVSNWKDRPVTGVPGLPPLNRSSPRVSKWEYENLFKIVDPSLINQSVSPEDESPSKTQPTEMVTERSLPTEASISPQRVVTFSGTVQGHSSTSVNPIPIVAEAAKTGDSSSKEGMSETKPSDIPNPEPTEVCAPELVEVENRDPIVKDIVDEVIAVDDSIADDSMKEAENVCISSG